MGALQTIRSKSTLLVAVIAVGLLAFIVPWGEIGQFLNVTKDKAFVVNGEVVKTGEYARRLQQEENLRKMMTADGQLSEEEVATMREDVFQEMVTEKLLNEQCEILGLSVSKAEFNDMVYGVNLSPVLYQIPYFYDSQSRGFSRAALTEFLSTINQAPSADAEMRNQQLELQMLWNFIENKMKYDRLGEKYALLVAGSALVNDIEAKSYYEDSKNIATLAYVSADYDQIDDATIEVSDAEIQDLYNIRKENFYSQYPSRIITYFVKNVLPSEADFEETASQMYEIRKELEIADNAGMIANQYSTTPYFDANIPLSSQSEEIKNFVKSASVGDIHGPTRVGQNYLMYKYISKTNAPERVQIKMLPIQSFDPTQTVLLADSLQNVLKAGKSFETLAAEMYPNMPINEGEWVTEIQLVQSGITSIKDKVFSANKGEVFAADLGGMKALIKITDKSETVEKVNVATINVPVIISDKTHNTIDNEINQFLSENKDPSKFGEAAQNAGYNLFENEVIYPHFPTLNNVRSARDVIKWAFNESEGEIKKFDNTSNTWVVALVTDKAPKGYRNVNNGDVKEMLKSELIREKKAVKLVDQLVAQQAASIASLAENLNTKVDSAKFVTFQMSNIPGLGYEPIINVASKVGSLNSLSKPQKGNHGVYVLNVANRTQDESVYDAEEVKSMLSRENNEILMRSAAFTLINKMDVEDNRIMFY